MTQTTSVSFKPRARLLQLVGDELIRSPRLAVFELVKNAYDADAENVWVSIEGLSTNSPEIVVRDDGTGMSLDILSNIWFVLAHDHKEKMKDRGETTELGRTPMGEKGIGRFAVHKLGNRISLATREINGPELIVDIDWSKALEEEFLEEVPAEITERAPIIFKGESSGTEIRVSQLRSKEWTRGDLRRLYRDVISICSPFDAPGEFDVHFKVPGRESDYHDIPDVGDILDQAPWRFKFSFDGNNFDWEYEFVPPPKLGSKVERRKKTSAHEEQLLLPKTNKKSGTIVATPSHLIGIGPISGEFFAYDRGKEILGSSNHKQLITNFLDENGGVRVYRDGVRVYNYGEEDDDWLGLDYRRFLTPAKRISRNLIIGAINLEAGKSDKLIEKTNREGFIENEEFSCLKLLVLGAFQIFETERALDKDAIRKVTQSPKLREADKVLDPIEQIRKIAKQKKVFEDFEPSLIKLESNYNQFRETMLQAGLSGLGLATVFHEIEHAVTAISRTAKKGGSMEQVMEQARELEQLLSGVSSLLRSSEKKEHKISDLVNKAKQNQFIRFRSHRVQLNAPILEKVDDFSVFANSRLVIGALTNLLDNAFYWMRARWPARPSDQQSSPRKIYIGASGDFEFGPALIFADTGPGFQDDPEALIEPFFTRRPEGMGLGLYYANLVMEMCGGSMEFPEPEDVDLPKEFDGAVIALVFPEK